MLAIRRQDLAAIHTHARAAYPHECCGLLLRSAGATAVTARACANLQQQRHAVDADAFPRGARTAYLLDPRALLDLMAAGAAAPDELAGFYHSHVDCPPIFSAEDRRRALDGDGQPDYPAAAHLVVGVYGGGGTFPVRVVGQAAYGWCPAARRFGRMPLRLAAG